MPESSKSLELNANQKYVIRVRARNNLNVYSDWSDSIVVSTDDLSFSVDRPYGLQVSSAIRSIFLSWEAVSDPLFSHYEIYVSKNSFNGVVNSVNKYGDYVGTFASINKVWDPTIPIPAQVDLTPGTKYYVVMRSVLKDGTVSPFSSEVSATTGYIGDTDLVVNSISGEKIQVDTLAADKITTGRLTAEVALAGKIFTATSGARVEIDSTGIRGYDSSGATPNFDYSTSTGDLVLRGDITAAGFFGEGLNLNDKNNWSLNKIAPDYQEIAINGSFDSGTGAEIDYWQAVSGCTIKREATTIRSGAGALRIDAVGGVDAIASSGTGTAAIPIDDSTSYSVRFYCRRQGSVNRTVRLTVNYYRSDGSFLIGGNGQISAIPNQTWDTFGDGQLHPPPGAAYVAIIFTVIAPAIGEQFYIDDLSIRPAIVGWSLGSRSSSYSVLDHLTATDLTISASRNVGSFIEYTNKRTLSSYGNTSNELIFFGAPIKAEPKRAYEAFFKSRLLTGAQCRAYVVVEFYDKNYNYLTRTNTSLISITNSWQTFETSFRTTDPSVGYFKIGLSFPDASNRMSASDSLYVDDLDIKQIPYLEDGFVFANSVIVQNDQLWDRTGFVMPAGAIIPWAGSFSDALGILPSSGFAQSPIEGSIIGSVPPGWIPCDGRQIEINVWPRLYSVIGDRYNKNTNPYTYSTTTTDSDPGTGVFRFNQSTYTSATSMFIDDSDSASSNIRSKLQAIHISSYVYIHKLTHPTVFIRFIVNSITSATGYTKINFSSSSIVSNGTFSNNDAVMVQFASPSSSGMFAVPDLRGRVPVGLDMMSPNATGDGNVLIAPNDLGVLGGTQTHTLTISEMPSHDHPPFNGSPTTPAFLSNYGDLGSAGLVTGGAGYALSSVTASRGGGLAHNNMQPYILLNYLIKG